MGTAAIRTFDWSASALAKPAIDGISSRQGRQVFVQLLAEGVWRHMGLEETQLLPLAMQHFQEADWSEIADAFERNDDPGFGELPASEFERIFTRITNLLPNAGR